MSALAAEVAAARKREGWTNAQYEDEFVYDRETRICYLVSTRRKDGTPAEVMDWGEAFPRTMGIAPITADDAKPGEDLEWFDVGNAWVWPLTRPERDETPVRWGRAVPSEQLTLEVPV